MHGVQVTRTVHVCSSGAVADETLRRPQKIIEADAQTDLLDHLLQTVSREDKRTRGQVRDRREGTGGVHLVCIFGIDVVLDGLHALLVEVLRRDLDQVRNFRLRKLCFSTSTKSGVQDLEGFVLG